MTTTLDGRDTSQATETTDGSATATGVAGLTAPQVPVARSRGRLVLEKKAVERIAAQAALEAAPGRTGGVSGGFLGFATQTDLTAAPATSVDLVGSTAAVRVDVTVAYPTPIRAATAEVRRHVMSRVRDLTGVEVTRVDINVTALKMADASSTRTVS